MGSRKKVSTMSTAVWTPTDTDIPPPPDERMQVWSPQDADIPPPPDYEPELPAPVAKQPKLHPYQPPTRRERPAPPVQRERPVEAQPSPVPQVHPEWAQVLRRDGTPKGEGFFGPLELPDGGATSEYSIGVESDGKEMEIPTLVPTLTEAELDLMVSKIIPNGEDIPQPIIDKALEHARQRMSQGLPVFADADDQPSKQLRFTFQGTIYNFEPGRSRRSIEQFFNDKLAEEQAARKQPDETSTEYFKRQYLDKMSDKEVIRAARQRPDVPKNITAEKARQKLIADMADTRSPEKKAADEEIVAARPASQAADWLRDTYVKRINDERRAIGKAASRKRHPGNEARRQAIIKAMNEAALTKEKIEAIQKDFRDKFPNLEPPSAEELSRGEQMYRDADKIVGGFGIGEDVAVAGYTNPEDRALLLAAVKDLASRGKPREKRGWIGRTTESFLRGGVGFLGAAANTLPDFVAGDELSESDKMFRQDLEAAYSSGDPLVREEDPFYKRWSTKAAGMAYPMIASVTAGRVLRAQAAAGTWASRGLGALGAGGTYAPQMYQDTYYDLRREGVSPEGATVAGGVSAVLQAAIEVIEIDPILGESAGRYLKQSVRKAALDTTKRYGKEVSEEFLQAVADESIQEFALWYEDKTGQKGMGERLKRASQQGVESLGPMLFLMGPGAMRQMARADWTGQVYLFEQQKKDIARLDALPGKLAAGGIVSRTDAAAWERQTGEKLPPDQAKRTDQLKTVFAELEAEEAAAVVSEAPKTPVQPPKPQDTSEPTQPVETPPEAVQEPGAPSETTGTKNVKTEELRKAAGLPPRVKGEKESVEEWETEAARRIKENPDYPNQLASALIANPRPVDKAEQAALGQHIRDLENRRLAGEDVRDELIAVVEASEKVGTEWSHSGQSRQTELLSDFSVAEIVRRHIKAVKEKPTAEQMAKYEKMADEISKLKGEVAEEQTKRAEAEADKLIAEIADKRRETIKSRYEKQYAAAADYGIDPDALREAASERAEVEAKEARKYNAAYRAVVKATGLSPKVIRDIENAGIVDIAEYRGLDKKAGVLAREYPELGLQAEEADVQQSKDYAQSLAELIKEGPRPVPQWHDKLNEVASEMAKEGGFTPTEDSRFPWEYDPDEFAPEPTPQPGKKAAPAKKPAKAKRKRLQEAASEALRGFKRELGSLVSMGGLHAVSPGNKKEQLARVAESAGKVVKAYVDLGINSFMEFLSNVKQGIGTLTRDHVTIFREAWDAAEVESPLGENPEPQEIASLAKKLTEWVVESGIEEREDVIDMVHDELGRLGIDLTREEVMQAMSDYGKFRKLSRAPVKVKVRGIRGEIRELLKLQSMEEGEAPLKTGQEQAQLTDEGRRIQKRVHERMKEGGFKAPDRERAMKSALDSTKTATKNRISDLENAIQIRERIANQETPVKPDAELLALRKERDELNKTYRQLFPPKRKKSVFSDAHRLQMSERMLEGQVKQLEKDLAEGRLGPKPKRPQWRKPEKPAQSIRQKRGLDRKRDT
jgi:hypothetical protein